MVIPSVKHMRELSVGKKKKICHDESRGKGHNLQKPLTFKRSYYTFFMPIKWNAFVDHFVLEYANSH